MSFGPPPPAHPPGPPQPPPPPQGPEFLAADRGRAVVVDAVGVCLENYGHTTEFGWHEVANVHFTGQGTCLRVGVAHASGAFIECMVDAKRPEQLHQWFAELSPVLGFYLNGRPGHGG